MDVAFFDLTASSSEMDAYFQSLSSAEQARAQAFKFAIHRDRYIIAHGILREKLSECLGLPPEDIVFTENQFKKPLTEGIHFNLSHSDDKMMLVMSKTHVVGVDVERVKPEIVTEELAKTSFSSDEFAAFMALPEGQRVDAFFHVWTCKEALIKAIGEGIHFGLANFSIDMHEPKLIAIKNYQTTDWQLQSIEAPVGFKAAIVCANNEESI